MLPTRTRTNVIAVTSIAITITMLTMRKRMTTETEMALTCAVRSATLSFWAVLPQRSTIVLSAAALSLRKIWFDNQKSRQYRINCTVLFFYFLKFMTEIDASPKVISRPTNV